MRIAELQRTIFLFTALGARVLSLPSSPFAARPPFTRAVRRSGFRPDRTPTSRFSGPEDALPISATRRGTRHSCERVDPRPRRRMTYLRCVRLLPSRLSPRATRGNEPRQRRASEEARRARTGPTRAKAHATLRTRESPPRTEPHTSMSCARPRGRRNPSRILRAHPATHRTRGAMRRLQVSGRASPREGRCVRRRPRCVPPSSVRACARGSLPAFRSNVPPVYAASDALRRGPTLCDQENLRLSYRS